MKHIAIGIILCAALTGCNGLHLHMGDGIKGSGKAKTESRTVSNFSQIELTGSPDVVWTKGDKISVSVTTDDNLLEHLKTEVEGDRLVIHFDKSVNTNTDTIVKITSPSLEGAAVTGSGDIQATGVEGKIFNARISGSGNIEAAGGVSEVSAEVTGSGDCTLTSLNAEFAKARVTGSGNISLVAQKELEANVTGSGDIEYKGSPKVNSNVTGSGNVSKL